MLSLRRNHHHWSTIGDPLSLQTPKGVLLETPGILLETPIISMETPRFLFETPHIFIRVPIFSLDWKIFIKFRWFLFYHSKHNRMLKRFAVVGVFGVSMLSIEQIVVKPFVLISTQLLLILTYWFFRFTKVHLTAGCSDLQGCLFLLWLGRSLGLRYLTKSHQAEVSFLVLMGSVWLS